MRLYARAMVAVAVSFYLGCAHGSGFDRSTRRAGLEAVHQWTQALYPKGDIPADAFTWWLKQRPVGEVDASPNPFVLPDRSTAAPSVVMTDALTFVLSACAVHHFVPMILAAGSEPELEPLADNLRDWGEEHDITDGPWVQGGARGLMKRYFDLGSARELRERLRGEDRTRAPTAAEMAAGLYATAKANMDGIAHRGALDLGYYRSYAYVGLVRVPLTLAPLYALSAGADEEEVWEMAARCFEASAFAREDHEPRDPNRYMR